MTALLGVVTTFSLFSASPTSSASAARAAAALLGGGPGLHVPLPVSSLQSALCASKLGDLCPRDGTAQQCSACAGAHQVDLQRAGCTEVQVQAWCAGTGCAHGVLDPSGDVCCAASCGRCGGTSCQNLHGGRDNCCTSSVRNSNHSCAQHEPPCTMPPSPPAPPPPPAHTVNPKRGFVADGAKSCDTPLLLNASGWYYDYNQNNPYRSAELKGDCKRANATDQSRFVPM